MTSTSTGGQAPCRVAPEGSRRLPAGPKLSRPFRRRFRKRDHVLVGSLSPPVGLGLGAQLVPATSSRDDRGADPGWGNLRPMSGNREIHFSGRVDAPLYRRAHRVALGGVLPPWAVYALVAAALLVGLALFFLDWIVPAALVFSLGILGSLILAVHEASVRRSWKTSRLGPEPFEGSLDEEGLRLRSTGGEGEIPWDGFEQWKGFRSILVLYLSSRHYQILAEDFFETPEDWQAAHALVARKVRSTQHAERRRLLWTFVTWFTIFLVVAVLWQVFVRG